ncbi:MAG: sulfatase [Bacteroidales bacterium]|jgi:arylsulfatase A-like enzyme|nr:sulfatase [Bacteroidales bacterium]
MTFKHQLLLSGCVAAPLFSCTQGGITEKIRPNILFIYADDLGWTDVASGSQFYETPAIDRLASEGFRFQAAYSCGPNSAPSRASLLTGQYTPRHGVYTVGSGERGESSLRKLIPVENKTTLELDFVTIAEELQHAGYRTGLIGKWQLGHHDKGTGPQQQGFDFVVSGEGGTPDYFYPYRKKGTQRALPVHAGIVTGKEGDYLTDRLTDEAIRFIGEKQDKPFFLYLSHFAVHTPTQSKAAKIEKYKAKPADEAHLHDHPVYAGMVESLDESVGRLLHALDSLKIADHTVVIFFSDNGGNGGVTAQLPLKGAKGTLHEGGIRVPLFVRWPGITHPGASTYTPVIGVDFYPSLLEIAGVHEPLNRETDGVSFVPLLQDKENADRDIFWHFPGYLENGQKNKVVKGAFRTRPVSVIRSGDYKLLSFYEDGHLELYNLNADIGETNNLSHTNPEKTEELVAKLRQWKASVKAPEPTALHPDYKNP